MGRRWHTLHLIPVLIIAVTYLLPSIACQSLTSNMTSNSTLYASKNQTLMSPGGVFELGFYSGERSDSTSTIYTLAIWYTQTAPVKTVVWMADRSMNLSSNATLTLTRQGELQVYDGGIIMWTSSTTKLNVSRTDMLDTGNLVLRNTSDSIVWQSFNSPTDTLLPGQPFKASSNITMYSWLKANDWSNSRYTLNWTTGTHQLNASWQTPYPGWSTTVGPNYWSYVSTPSTVLVILNSDGAFQAMNSTTTLIGRVIGNSTDGGLTNRLRRITFDYDGNLRMYSWVVGNSTSWGIQWQAISDICTVYGRCGPFAVCTNRACACPEGFKFVNANDLTQGCERTKSFTFCTSAEQTMTAVESVDYPNGGDYKFYDSYELSACQQLCLSSCVCQACTTTTTTDPNGNVTCWLKKDYILNGQYSYGRNTYIRVGAQTTANGGLLDSQKLAILGGTLGSTVIFFGALLCTIAFFWGRQRVRYRQIRKLEEKWTASRGSPVQFTYREIRLLTRNFSEQIGKGGSGSIFKGMIGDCGAVAVKRLDKLSPEKTEFVNEVDIIGRIHHVNLVDLQGYCAEDEHRLLVYEYMERGSLDSVLFCGSGAPRNYKPKAPLILEWRSRFKIAVETAKGLAYLHEDVGGRRVIHCDIKPENILLDSTLSAKVADFGLARIMSKEQTRTMTMHIRGTCGYLAPEWTSEHMAITAKTDVYSYGMVLLEIISGRKNLQKLVENNMESMDMEAADWYFPLWAFAKVETGAFLEVVDPKLTRIVEAKEVERALLVAFWCINEKPHLRPSMAMVVQYLEGRVPVALPVPRPLFLDEIFGPVKPTLSFTSSSEEPTSLDSWPQQPRFSSANMISK